MNSSPATATAIRPRWWIVIVGIVEIILPTVFAVAGMVAPIPTFLGVSPDDLQAYCPGIDDLFPGNGDINELTDNGRDGDDTPSLFVLNVADELRGQASGMALGVLAALFMIYTPHTEVLWVTNLLVLSYLCILLVNYLAMWWMSNFIDTMGLAFMPPTMALHIYMLRRLRRARKTQQGTRNRNVTETNATETTNLLE